MLEVIQKSSTELLEEKSQMPVLPITGKRKIPLLPLLLRFPFHHSMSDTSPCQVSNTFSYLI